MPPPTEALPTNIQASIATAIAFAADANGAIIANSIKTEYLDPPYDDIAERCLEYRREYKRPPGKGHIDDVFADILNNPNHKQYELYKDLINSMYDQADKIDTRYIVSHLTNFICIRTIRLGLGQAIERYGKGGVGVQEDINNILRRTLRARNVGREKGFSLADPKSLDFLDRDTNDFCYIGIPQLDQYGCHPVKGEMLAFLSARNKGKSQFIGHCGKLGIIQGWTVIHYTLENSASNISMRYHQSLFNGVRREKDEDYWFTKIRKEDDGSTSFGHNAFKPDFYLDDPDKTERYLKKVRKEYEAKLRNLWIREFPANRLTFDDLEADLDELELTHHVVPDMVMIDYPQMMRLNRNKDKWESLDDLILDLYALAKERNVAMVVPQQGNRGAERATNVRSDHGGGSMGIHTTADNVITYSQTAAEEEHGLARLYLSKVRNDRARKTVLITQHYASSQFYMDSALMDPKVSKARLDYLNLKNSDIDEDEEDAAYNKGSRSQR
jgi:hypothetical protein